MPRHRVSLSEENVKIISFKEFNSYGTNYADRKKMKLLISKAVSQELTFRQRQCLTEYFYNGKTITEIALQLKLNKSTVTRHIQAAKKRIIHLAQYY